MRPWLRQRSILPLGIEETMTDFFSTVTERRTVRDFLPEPVPAEVLQRCLDAALLAPSSSNLQPWEFVVISSPEKRQAANDACLMQSPATSAPLLIALVAHRDTWRRNRDHIVTTFEKRGGMRASQRTYYTKIIPMVYTNGPFNLLGWWKPLVGRVASFFKAMPNFMTKTDVRIMSHKSTALAAATFMLALRAEGYDSCPMEGFDPWRAKRLLGLGLGSEVNMFIAVGKRSDKGVWWDRVLVPKAWAIREI